MTTSAKDRPASTQKKRKKGNAVSIIALLLGALLLLYPVVSTLANHNKLMRQTEAYSGKVADLSQDEKERQLQRAHEYNDRLLAEGPHARPPVNTDPGMEDYMSQLNVDGPQGMIARIRIPSIDVDLPVFHTTAPKVLYQGAGHMFGSTLPVGGDGTNAVLSAHTGMVNASMFDRLPTLKEGDDIFIDVMGERLRYKMTSREVVKPDDYEAVTYEPGHDKITLITCTPYGLNTDRLLVHAERYPLDPGNPEPSPAGFGWSWWMIAVVLIVLITVFLILWKNRRRRKKRKEREEQEAAQEHQSADGDAEGGSGAGR